MHFRTGAEDLDSLDYTNYPTEINDKIIFKNCKELIPPLNHEYACLENYLVINNVKRHFDKKYNHEIMKLGIKLKDRIIKLGDVVKHSNVEVYKNEIYEGYPMAIITTADRSIGKDGISLARINNNYKKIKGLYMLDIKNKHVIGNYNTGIKIIKQKLKFSDIIQKQIDKREIIKKIMLDDTGFESLKKSYHYFSKGSINLFPLESIGAKIYENEYLFY